MKVFLLFLDGVGVGNDDPAVNPFFASHIPHLKEIFGGIVPSLQRLEHRALMDRWFPVDANLGVEGLPQSGTGQATILTGLNGAKIFGKHFGPFVPSSLKKLIAEEGLYVRLLREGRRVSFVNAFPKRFFEYTDFGTRRLSGMNFAAVSAGLSLKTAEALASDRAVSADFVRERWKEMGHPEVHPVTPQQAGEHCAALINEHDLTVFDYWLTDHAGHKQDLSKGVRCLERLDGFLSGVLGAVDLRSTLILSVSDHGNLEDLGSKSHTRNPALGFAYGLRAEDARRQIRSLQDITPFVLECLTTNL